jgi:alanyl-tRNA synthetase
MAMQGVTSNYDTDVFTPLILKVEQQTGLHYTNNNQKDISDEQNSINIAIRVVVDHVRAVAFAIADGQLPSNTGAGYVIRRILRRAIRYGFTFLHIKKPFINELVAVLADQMGDFFPEIRQQQNLVTQVIREEEASFLRTLEQGLQLLEEVIKTTQGTEVSGDKAFELYDTFGFPKDLTSLILKEKGMTYNEEEFDIALQKQKARSRAASEMATDDWTILSDDLGQFVGYDQTEAEVRIVRYRKIDRKKDGVFYQIMFNQTPFYPEGGGQVGDKGWLKSANEHIAILDTKKENNLILHVTQTLPENPSATFQANVDTTLRTASAKNHSATHLLHQALRHILGTHVEQKGSLVSPGYLRFDFSHFAKLTDHEWQQVEDFVNARIMEQWPLVERRNIPFQQAIDEGAMALFGEKYGDSVRAIKFGDSMELCGGIHVANTAQIWRFKIKSEGAVAAGIRRIEAITGDAVIQFYQEQEAHWEQIKEVLKAPQDVVRAVQQLVDEQHKLKKQLEGLVREKGQAVKKELEQKIQQKQGVSVLIESVDLDANTVKDIAFALGQKHDNLFLVIGSVADDKPSVSCYISKDLVDQKGLNAGTIVRELGKFIQGGGGGQANFATAGGKHAAGIPDALKAASAYL